MTHKTSNTHQNKIKPGYLWWTWGWSTKDMPASRKSKALDPDKRPQNGLISQLSDISCGSHLFTVN